MKKSNFSTNEEVFFEESVFDSLSSKKDLGNLEMPISRRAFFLVIIVMSIIGILFFSRIFYLGILQNNFYSARAEGNFGKETYTPGNRGIIYDRYGKPLVQNVPSFSVSVKIADFVNDSAEDKAALSGILEMPLGDMESQIMSQNIEKSASVVLARNVDPAKIIQIKSLNLNGVNIISDYTRQYLDGPIFSQILGYTGQDKNGEVVGKSGIESYYNEELKGQDGKTVVYKDARGKVLDSKIEELPQNGKDITLSIDYDLQKYFYNSLSQALANLGRTSGAGIAINPQNGEILALISLPSFNNNAFSKFGSNSEKLQILNSPYKPLFNRAVSGVYTPGSTIKPMEAVAALKEGVVTPQTKVFSAGYIEIPNPYNPSKPSRFLDWKALGWVNLYSAIASSCDVYFYSVGGGFGDIKGLGIDKLKSYWQKFGLGQKTGIDLPGESVGFLPDPQEKEKDKNEIWRIGDTYNVSIGEGDLQVSPIQLIDQIAGIGNNGIFYQPHLLKDAAPKVSIDLTSLNPYIQEVKKGMGETVSKPYGTANMLNSIPIAIGAKTGSSQVANNTKTNAFFVGYMPLQNPEIAILVLVEDAKEGSLNAVPVAKDVMNWYYNNRMQKNGVSL
jgi:penicillin-binding protein 2